MGQVPSTWLRQDLKGHLAGSEAHFLSTGTHFLPREACANPLQSLAWPKMFQTREQPPWAMWVLVRSSLFLVDKSQWGNMAVPGAGRHGDGTFVQASQWDTGEVAVGEKGPFGSTSCGEEGYRKGGIWDPGKYQGGWQGSWQLLQGLRNKGSGDVRCGLEEGMATHSSILVWRIPMDRGAWQVIVLRVEKSRTQSKWLSTHTGTLTHVSNMPCGYLMWFGQGSECHCACPGANPNPP